MLFRSSLAPKNVVIHRNGSEVTIPVNEVAVGDLCIIRPGDRFPTDGIVIEGRSDIDNSLLTGESLPIEIQPGYEVIAGAINLSGRLVIKAKRVGSDTELARITKMVLTAQSEKAPIQRLADRISSVFVPAILLIAVATAFGWIWFGYTTSDAVRAAVAVLVIACPCALGLATPVALLVATGHGARSGIVLRRAAALESAKDIDVVLFDKTGTLTEGVMQVRSLVIPDLGSLNIGVTAAEILLAVYTLERESNHPMAIAITKNLAQQSISQLPISDVSEVAGQGVAGRVKFSSGALPVLIGKPESIRREIGRAHV